MTLWTYRFRPQIDGCAYNVQLKSALTSSHLTVSDGTTTREDTLHYYQEPYRLQQVALGDLVFETGPRNWLSVGLRVRRGDDVLHQSHPDPFAFLPQMQKMTARKTQRDDPNVDMGKMKKNAPAIATDIALGVLFFVTAKLSDLRTAALVAAGVGIALYGVQWVLNRVFDRLGRPRLDLLGGLAMFGIVMLLISAAFSWYFDSERAVQLKSTYLGLLAASFFAIDAWRGAPYLGKRLALYIAYNDIDPQRLASGFAIVGAAMALVNAALVFTISKDWWLYYNLWGDMLLAVGLSMWAIERARRPAAVPTL